VDVRWKRALDYSCFGSNLRILLLCFGVTGSFRWSIIEVRKFKGKKTQTGIVILANL